MEIKFLTLIYEFVAWVSGKKNWIKIDYLLVQKFNYLTRLSNHVAFTHCVHSIPIEMIHNSHVIGTSSDNTNS